MPLIETFDVLASGDELKSEINPSERELHTYMPRKQVSEKEIVVSAAVPRHKPATTTTRAKRVVADAPVTQATPEAPSREQIASLAYSYWQARGYQGGSPEQDWLRAELELVSGTTA
jgi:hypothetical protein